LTRDVNTNMKEGVFRRFAAAVLVTAVLVTPGGASARAATAAATTKPAKFKLEVKRDTVAGGDHWRIVTEHGPIHVWRPPGYHDAGAGMLIYVHGHGTTPDGAWKDYNLAAQFRASKQNALFVVAGAQQNTEDSIKWEALGDLLRAVSRGTKLPRPGGRVVVMGHSGAFKTIEKWLDYTPLDHIILLDALFGGIEEYQAWLETAKGHEENKLTLVATTGRTMDNSRDFIRKLKGVVVVDGIPDDFSELTKKQRVARVLFVKAQYGHMELVTGKKAIPLLLRRTPLHPL
jgi:hypothetical protein